MGNKAGKFNVPTTDAVNKDEAIVSNGTEVKVNDVQNGEANGDHTTPEVNNVEEAQPDNNTAQPKKKNVMSWLKKVSIRKEKKPKAPKQQNGVKEEVNDVVKENGDIEEEKVPEVAPEAEIVTNGHCEEAEADTEDVVESCPISNGHVEHNVTETAAESPAEEEQ